MTQYMFFSGKGGVGKTTMSAATAVHYAMSGKTTLIVTTDPASNLADVFEQEIGHKITPIKGVKNLSAMEIDPDEATKEYKERIVGPFRDIMPVDVVASIEEQFNSPCTTEMASFDRFVDFMETDEYDVIVSETNKILDVHTGYMPLRDGEVKGIDTLTDVAVQLFERKKGAFNLKGKIPYQCDFVIERPDISRLWLPENGTKRIFITGKGGVGKTTVSCIAALFVSQKGLKTLLVTTDPAAHIGNVLYPEYTPMVESYRAMLDLKDAGIETQFVVANMVLPENVCKNSFFKSRRQMQIKYLREIKERFDLPILQFPLMEAELKGLKRLGGVIEEIFNA